MIIEAQLIAPNSFVRVNSAGELVSDILVSSIATNAYVDNAIAALINLAPSSLDTLSEIATELNLKQYKILSGYTLGSGVAIVNTDNIEQAFGKVQASINTNAASIATNAAAIVTINSTLGTVVYLGSSQSVTGIKSFTQVIKADGGLDVTATAGSDVLNIGTSNADVINIGWSGAQVVIQGSVFSNNVTNLEIADKLIRLNKGGSAASAVSTGFEIEENSIVTGYFATNGTRDGYDFKAPGITDYVTFSLAALTAHRTLMAPDADGTLALTSDLSSYQPSDANLTTLAGLTPTTNNFIVSVAGAWASRTPAQVKTTLAIANTDVSGLGTLSTQSGTFSGTSSGTNTGDQDLSVKISTGSAASLSSLVLTGTAGAGYLQLLSQNSPPSAVSGNMILYSNSSNSFSLVKRNAANSADITRTLSFPDSSVTFTYPGASDTLAGLGTAQTWTAIQSYAASNIPTATNTYDLGANSSIGDWRKLYVRTIGVADVSGTDQIGNNLTLTAGIGTGLGAETVVILRTQISTSSASSGTALSSLKDLAIFGVSAGSSGAGTSAMWLGIDNASRTTLNYALQQTGGLTTLNGTNNLQFKINSGGNPQFSITTTAATFSAGMLLRMLATTGTDAVGNNFTQASGLGSGAGTASSWILQTPTALASGTTAQTLTTRVTVNSTGALFAVIVNLKASATSAASLNIPSGTAPTSPNDGDIWYDGTNIKMRIGGTTKTFTLT